jgi:hypothetical protein
MHSAQKLIDVAIGLGGLGLALSAAAILALLDIVQGVEPDLALEWTVVWIAVPISALAQALLLVAVRRLRRQYRSLSYCPDETSATAIE